MSDPKRFKDGKFYRINEFAGTGGDKPIPSGVSTIWSWVAKGLFPKPIKLGPRTTVWRGENLNEWEESLNVEAADQERAGQ